MAPIEKKRKDGPINESSARTKSSTADGPPSKRLRADHKEYKAVSNSLKPLADKISRAREDDVPFPRGGASVLSPLEHKQIQIEATRDALFEQHGTKAARAEKDGADGENLGPVKKKSKPKEKSKKRTEQIEADDDVVKIEGLSYKRIVPGSLVLGMVAQINAHDIAISLPNNLTGYLPMTSISDKISQRIATIAISEEQEEDLDDIELEKLFFVGQYLRAFVVSTGDEPYTSNSGKSKRRIELSIRPQQSNNSLTARDIIVHSTVMASVTSVEDHGLIMDLGLPDTGMRGFISSKEIGRGVELSNIIEGVVYLCMVTGLSSNGKIVKLTADTLKIGNVRKLNHLAEAPSVDSFLPGTAVQILVADITSRGISGKVMGMVNVTADLLHSGASSRDLEKKYTIGSKIMARIIYNFPTADPPKLGVSLLDHVMALAPQLGTRNGEKREPLAIIPLSTVVDEVIVRKVEPDVGLFVETGIKGVLGFVHISRVKDGKIEKLSESTGAYKLGSAHRGRLIGYNSLDGVYLVSLEQSILQQPFLRIEDLKIGEVVKGKIEKIIVNSAGVGGVLVKVADGITGFVPEMHMADVQLLNPEKKFREGMAVTVRVLSTNPSNRQIRLTLKKSLVNSEAAPFTSYGEISVGMQSPGTLVNIIPSGAVVQFYGNVRGFLPVSEMSETYIQDPNQHFRVGQVVNVHVMKVDAEASKLTVSCKDPSAFGPAQQTALKALKVGEIISAVVTEKSSDDVSVEIHGHGLRAVLAVGHLTDGTRAKNLSALQKLRVGQTLTDLVVLEKLEQKRLVSLTNKPSLVKDAKNRTLLRSFEDLKEGRILHGFVKNVTLTAVFVQFGGGIVGILPKNKLTEESLRLPEFGMIKFQSVEVRVISIDHGQRRFVLSMADVGAEESRHEPAVASVGVNLKAINPVDQQIVFLDDLALGMRTKARVVSVKETQLNVQLADNIQGRIDVSQVFDSWDQIKDRKRPLRIFSAKQIVDVQVMGIHDARNHRFLPITHRSGKTPVFELSAKLVDQTPNAQEPLTLDKIEVGSSWIVFVNNIGDDCIWVNLSPNVRGRIRALDISDDVSLLKDLELNFPVGSAIRARVTSVDIPHNRLDLSSRSAQASEVCSFHDLATGMVVAGKVTRVNERQIMVQLSESISGPVNLPDLADDFSETDPARYAKNDIVRVCIIEIDASNKRIRLSTRPSRVLNSSLVVQDPEVLSGSQLNVNDVLRGFVKNVSDKGVFVNLGGNVTGYVRVSDLSDSYIKDWKSHFHVNQLVKGKVISVGPLVDHVQLSLKASIFDKDYVEPLAFNDINAGQIFTGKIRKVEDFGVFIVINGSANVSGLCHQSEMADKRVHDVKKLYTEGDSVKAIVLRVDPERRRINFGLKASYFNDGSESQSELDDNDDSAMHGVKLDEESNMEESANDEDMDILLDVEDIRSTKEQDDEKSSEEKVEHAISSSSVAPLNAGRFDWSTEIFGHIDQHSDSEIRDNATADQNIKKKRRKSEIKIDRTGDLDVNGPQSPNDFERLLLGKPDSSQLWIEYMAFQMQLSELSKARNVAERAIKTISIREETEKMNVWIALLNLETTYGTDETVEEVFGRACQYNDAQEIHERLTSIYIQSGKHDKADELFQVLIKKFSQSATVWYNYAHFLHSTLSSPDRARALLPRATQSLPPHTHLNLTLKFAALEFHSTSGSAERGRTIFEGLLSTFPKRLDIWNQLLDLEIQQRDDDIIRGVFERVLKIKGLKPRGAKAWFKRWVVWEDMNGDKKSQEKVRAKAEEWVGAAVLKITNVEEG